MTENPHLTGTETAANSSAHEPPAPAEMPAGFRSEFEAAPDSSSRFKVIRSFFRVKAVASEDDIRPGALYYLRGKDQDFLIRIVDQAGDHDSVAISLPLSEQAIKPMPKPRFIDLGKKKNLGLLLPKPELQDQKAVDADVPKDERDSIGEDSVDADSTPDIPAQSILDNSAFNQLMDSARRSTLVRSVQPISNVRDREFRIGDYRRALVEIERLFRDFDAAAKQRDQRLRREEMDIKSGRIKISPKEKNRKNQENTRVSQSVERARRAFSRVLNGLRTLEGGQRQDSASEDSS